MAGNLRKPLPISRYGNADNSDSVVAEEQTILAANAINIAELTRQPEVDRGEYSEAAGEIYMDYDGKMELLDTIGTMAEEKDKLNEALEQKSRGFEAMTEEVQRLKNELDQMQSEHGELNDFFETEKSTLLESHGDEKRRFHDLDEKEKILLEETHQNQAEAMRESYQQEKTALKESYEEEKHTLHGLHEQEKAAWRKDKLKEKEKLEHVTAARDELQQEILNDAEQLQNANQANAAAEKRQRVLLDRLRDLARHAQCQPSDPTSDSGLRPGKKLGWIEKKLKQVQNKMSTSSSGASKPTTLEMLDTDGIFQALTERIDQLAATESKIYILEEQSADLRSEKDDLESKLSRLNVRNAELQDENETLQAEASEQSTDLRSKEDDLESKLSNLNICNAELQKENENLQAEAREKTDLRSQKDDLESKLSSLNVRNAELQKENENLQAEAREETTDLRSQKDDLESKLSSLNIRNTELREENENLQTEISAQSHLPSKILNQEKRLVSLTDKAQRVQTKLNNLQERFDMEEGSRNRLEIEVNKKEADLSRLNSRIQELEDSPSKGDTVIVLCIDESMSAAKNTVREKLTKAMLEKIDESTDRTFLSLITHGDERATIHDRREFCTINEMRRLLVNLDVRSFTPAYSSAMRRVVTVYRAARHARMAKVKIYFIGDGYSSPGGLKWNREFEELETREEVKIWGFCLGVHPHPNQCCFSVLDGKCHDHCSGFDSNCVLPI